MANLPPYIADLEVYQEDGRIMIAINISDLNSARDIDYVYINITNDREVVRSVAYRKLDSNDTPSGVFVDNIGHGLIPNTSRINMSRKNTGIESCYLELVVWMEPGDGEMLEIEVKDMNGRSAIYRSPYHEDTLPPFDDAFFLLIAAILAIIVTIVTQLAIRLNREGTSVH